MFKANNRNTRKSCEICSKLTIEHQNDVIDVVLVFLLLTLTIFHSFFQCFFSVVHFEQVNIGWVIPQKYLMPRCNATLPLCKSHFTSLDSFYIYPWKQQKTRPFVMFSGGIERDQWQLMAFKITQKSYKGLSVFGVSLRGNFWAHCTEKEVVIH